MKKYIIKEQMNDNHPLFFVSNPIRIIGYFDSLEKAEDAKNKMRETHKILSIEVIELNKEK